MTAPERYLGYLAVERGLSPLTRENYARDLAVLVSLCADVPLAELTPIHIRRFVAALHGKGLSGRSIARKLSAWRGFFDFLAQREGFGTNPCIGIRPPKSPRTLPQALSVEQAARLMQIAGDDKLGARDRAMCELFYSSGLRLAELVGLDLGRLDLLDATVTVTGKGSKTRIVPVGALALEAIRAWLPQRALLAPADEAALFVSQRGRRISARAVQLRLKVLALRQGLNVALHPHTLRHSFASHVLQSSGDLRAVQEMLGHANISTTQVYTHLDFQHLARVYDQAHPRARKK